MRSDAVLNLRIPNEIKEALQRAARDNLRNTSSMATWALAQWLSDNHYLTKSDSTNATSRSPKGKR